MQSSLGPADREAIREQVWLEIKNDPDTGVIE
jgi:hypothetical protein